ncbi:hypothetical protein AWRI1631 153660 [Kluyveromyces marxianus]|nr:hypothetical protein AWRI1631 153660 [Kluyveromyces marxianus]
MACSSCSFSFFLAFSASILSPPLAGIPAMRALNPSSSIALIPNFFIFSSFFGPASSPNTTTEVFFDIDFVTRAPYFLAKFSEVVRSRLGSVPVNTMVKPSRQSGRPSGISISCPPPEPSSLAPFQAN